MFKTAEIIQTNQRRESVEIYLPDGRVLSGLRNLPVGVYLNVLQEEDAPPIVGAVVNGELRELTYPIEIESKVRPITMADADGARIYRRSLTFLLEAAFVDLFPDATLTIDHSVASGGFFCQVTGRPPLSPEELETLRTHMLELVAADLPFERKIVPLGEAIEYFKSKGQYDKIRLLKFRQKDTLVLYRLGNFRDYHHGYMVPMTGYLKLFGLIPMGTGFVLQYPRRHSPNTLTPMPAYPKLLVTFQEYGKWLARLGIDSVGALNESILAGRIRSVIMISEALHEQQIAEIATQISEHRDRIRVVLISGPSSSGKTTFSKRLAVQLLAQGISPFALELDNYFVDREKTPKDENGEYNYEALDALDLNSLNDHLRRLIQGEKVQLFHYNFKAGRSEPGDVIQLNKDQLVIMEGIHGLDPKLIPSIPTEQTYRIYVSALTQLNLDRQNRISTTDTRMLRRILRDAHTRGYSAQQTIGRWESVRRGERLYIFPYQENADVIFNSALVYELSVLKPLVEPLLRQVPYGTPEYLEAKRLLTFLEWFLPIKDDLIPDNSILREFIGGSILEDFTLWQGSS